MTAQRLSIMKTRSAASMLDDRPRDAVFSLTAAKQAQSGADKQAVIDSKYSYSYIHGRNDPDTFSQLRSNHRSTGQSQDCLKLIFCHS